MTALAKHLYYGYFAILPALALSTLIIKQPNLPEWLTIDSGLARIVYFCLIIAVVGTYIGTATELVPFPTSKIGAVFSAFTIPASFAIATFVNQQPFGDTLVMSFIVELVGVLGFLFFMVNKKFFYEKDRFWFGLVVIYLIITGLIGSLAILWSSLVITTLITALGLTISGITIAQRYYVALKQPNPRQEDNVVYILVGILALFSLPGMAALYIYYIKG